MSATTNERGIFSNDAARTMSTGSRIRALLGAIPTWVLWLLVVVWTLPTIGLFMSSLRRKEDINDSGWWNAVVPGNWGDLTLANYGDVWSGSSSRSGVSDSFINTFAIVLPATVVSVALATIAAYAFSWISFKGRDWLFVYAIAMLALPNQMTFVPLLKLYQDGASWTVPFTEFTMKVFPTLGLSGTAAAVWLTHIAFGLPLGIFLLHNYISRIPKDLFEAARIDGATHFTIFTKLVLPLSMPAIASFGIFAFLWTWNDFLIASVFLDSEKAPLTVALVNLAGERGQDAHLQYPAAFISILIPLIVFFSMQKYFVRGLLAGSVKG